MRDRSPDCAWVVLFAFRARHVPAIARQVPSSPNPTEVIVARATIGSLPFRVSDRQSVALSAFH